MLLFMVIFIVLLVAFFAWQHRYFHPASLRETKERERKLLEQTTKEIQDARSRKCN